MKLLRLQDIRKIQEFISAYIYSSLELLKPFLPVILIIAAVLIVLGIVSILLRKLLSFKYLIEEESILLQLTPPSATNQDPSTTERLFALIHALGSHKTFKDKILDSKPRVSLELVSTQTEGIRYLIKASQREVIALKRSLLSYLPELEITEVKDYLPKKLNKSFSSIVELRLSHHFAHPLKKQNNLDKHDPIAYITGMMTKLLPDEMIALQVIASPTKSAQAKQIESIAIKNGDVLGLIETSNLARTFFGNGKPSFSKNTGSLEQELVGSIYEKVKQPLFEATVRLLICSPHNSHLRERTSALYSSFSAFTTSNQGFVHTGKIQRKLLKSYNLFAFKHRLPRLFKQLILSVSEVSDLYHFPHTNITKTEDIVKSHSKQLPAPLSLKNNSKMDVTFAQNTYGGSTTPIGLTEEERRRHVYILGATGTGKTTLLLSMINQDIQHGKGVCLIDPHGDLAESLLPLIPKNRIKDVIYFNPDDSEFPIALNLLELPKSRGVENLRDQEFITESIISLFNKLYPDHTARPRMEYILRNTIYTAFLTSNPTIFTILKLLVDAPFRRTVVKHLATLPDKNLYNFWKYEFNKAGDYQKVSMIMPITNKIGRFQFSPTAKGILEQEKSKIDFEDIMDSGKILICNVSKGRLGEDISEMFGILLLTKIQLAALRRAKKKVADRKDFYLYVDEFQNFATPAFAQILSEARKYRLNAILAHQTVSQIEDKSLVNVTLANAGTVICFRTANPLDEELMLPQFSPYIDPGEISNLPSYHFYMKVSAIEPQTSFSGETLPVKIPDNPEKVTQIIESSRVLYATHLQHDMTTTNLPKSDPPREVVKHTAPLKIKRKLH